MIHKALHNNSSSFTSLIYTHSNDLKYRYYKGQSYCGAVSNENDVNIYRWAQKNNQHRLIAIRTFTSTSRKKEVAEKFRQLPENSDKLSVLLEFSFPVECNTAINLNAIIDKQLPCLSYFQNEEEILLLPFTLFK
ncbi:unnamed protein product, partial [Didymodactylos carnosus]